MGATNETIASGIDDLLTARAPQEFRACQTEKVTLVVAAAFLLPAALVLFALVVRLTIGRAWVERKLGDLAADVSRRRPR